MISILFFNIQIASNQSISKDNNSGFWLSETSWEGNISPDRDVINTDITIFGEIISRGCLSINLCSIDIYDTLVINGNLTLKNTSVLNVYQGGLLLVYGDFVVNNKVDIINDGTIVISGDFNMLGANSMGSFENSRGNLYLFDETPQIKEELLVSDLKCTNPEYYPDSCFYYNYAYFIISDFYSYYLSFEYAQRTIKTEGGNDCFSVEIIADTNQGCVRSDILFNMLMVGNTDNTVYLWDFGEGSVPRNVSVNGPVLVNYNSDGLKNVSISMSDDGLESNSTFEVQIFKQPETNKIIAQSGNESVFGNYIEKVCIGTKQNYWISHTSKNSVIEWVLADDINSTNNDSLLTIHWTNPEGEYVLSAVEISEHGCTGTLSEASVLVEKCKEISIFTRNGYAFTPNGDNYNDTWIIENIEDYPMAKIYVYNKLGKLVYFSNSDYQNNWDGSYNNTKLPLDSYFFLIDFSYYQKGNVKGVLTIIR